MKSKEHRSVGFYLCNEKLPEPARGVFNAELAQDAGYASEYFVRELQL
jgi:hypothetical protein